MPTSPKRTRITTVWCYVAVALAWGVVMLSMVSGEGWLRAVGFAGIGAGCGALVLVTLINRGRTAPPAR